MTTLRGLCTMPDGSVRVVCPAHQAVMALHDGGNIINAFRWRYGFRSWLTRQHPVSEIMRWWWADEIPMELAKAWEVEKFLREKRWRPDRSDREELARRFIDALDKGGLDEREAVSLIIDKDAPAWSTAHEIVDVADLPPGTYRNAWRRSKNGGPIWIDEAKAQEIDEACMWESYYGARTA